MLLLRKYQETAVGKLLTETAATLRDVATGGRRRQKIVLQAPTGAGKTVLMAEVLRRLTERDTTGADTDWAGVPPRLAFVWIAPGQLHLQSYGAIQAFFRDTRTVRPMQWADLETAPPDGLAPADVLFVNWQSISSDKNRMVRPNERAHDLFGLLHRTRLAGTEVVVVLDEAHLFATRGPRAERVLVNLSAAVEIDVSATPDTSKGRPVAHVHIRRSEVVAEGMIKRGISLNPALDAAQQGGETLDRVLLREALARRAQLAAAYRAQGVALNPLLLVQLPSGDQDAGDTAPDRAVRAMVEQYLTSEHAISLANGRLAVWLASEKTNLEGITRWDSGVDVLIFKQAIALGWDCPRAGVLLIYRELKSEAFTVQTVGRILRMPEQRHYPDDLLNLGYVYTNLSRDTIRIDADASGYLSMLRAERRADYALLTLPSQHVTNQRGERNRLGDSFRATFNRAAEARWGLTLEPVPGADAPTILNAARLRARGLLLDVARIEIAIPADVELVPEVGVVALEGHRQRFAKTPFERNALLDRQCREWVDTYAKAESGPVLRGALVRLFETYLAIAEQDTVRILLAPQNALELSALVSESLVLYADEQKLRDPTRTREVEATAWDVPAVALYDDERHLHLPWAITHALQPAYVRRREGDNWADSAEEMAFITWLENDLVRPHLRWWHKNGASSQADFAVAYQKRVQGELQWTPFYPDFFLLLADGTLAVFDVKTRESDPDAPAKHNALHQWLARRRAAGHPCLGGVLLRDAQGNWRYPPAELPDTGAAATADIRRWTVWNPALPAG